MKKKLFWLVISMMLVSFLAASAPAEEKKNLSFEELDALKAQYVEGKILIKFKKETARKMSQSGIASAFSMDTRMGAMFSAFGIDNLQRVFPRAKPVEDGRMVHLPGGKAIPEPDLTCWYSGEVTVSEDLEGVAAKLRTDPNILYAEPDYKRTIDGNVKRKSGPSAPAAQPPVVEGAASQSLPGSGTDPLYSQQWHLSTINAPQAWSFLANNGYEPGGSHDVIVAVIDTGVDLNHPDLAANIWTNPREIPNNGIDDDGNGYWDDVHGVNVINNSGNPMDDHGHGTHVAGIIAAQGGNNLGVVGVAYNVQIMPIKAAQSSGVITTSDVADAIYYAVENGADVINMSFGGYSRSQVEADALAVGFSRAALVAAAGNDATVNLPCCNGRNFYPASYDWVLGVMASIPGGKLAYFSNYDCIPKDAHEYELRAPGINVMSTLPNESYAAWDGTSMSAPVVSGIAALVRTRFTDRNRFTSRFVMGQIASNLSGCVADAYKALTVAAKPDMAYFEHHLFDFKTLNAGNDEDGSADSGETIDMGVFVKNRWGGAKNVSVKIEPYGEGATVPDQYVTMLVDTVDYGAVDSFCRDDNGIIYDDDGVPVDVEFPFRFTVADDTPHNHVIPFRITVTCNNNLFTNDTTTYTSVSHFYVKVQRGLTISGELIEDTTWTSNHFYIVTGSIHVPQGITLTIEPGTKIAFDDDTKIVIRGNLIAQGTKAKRIEFTSNSVSPRPYSWDGIDSLASGNMILEYCDFSYFCNYVGNYYNTLPADKEITIRNCNFNDCSGYAAIRYINGTVTVDHNIFRNVGSYALYIYSPYYYSGSIDITNNVFALDPPYYYSACYGIYMSQGNKDTLNISGNSFMNVAIGPSTKSYGITVYDTNINNEYLVAGNYWGTTDEAEIQARINDYYDGFKSAKLLYQPFLTEPADGAPPQVKSVVTSPAGKLPVGEAQFTITFNSDMDQNEEPLVTFGSSKPYSDHTITGSWSDSRTWVGTYSITPLSGDGWNVVQVFQSRGATDYMPLMNDTRHQFEIMTQGTASMNLQATGGEGYVDLTWSQNDFDQLAGFNMYRATSLNGYYSRINTTLIGSDKATYKDTDVTPGQTYYYKFTVAKTDLSESDYSNVASAAPLDTEAPSISHTPVTSASSGLNLTINVDIYDNVGIESATLYYRLIGSTVYATGSMTHTTGSNYSATIIGSNVRTPGLEYYIEATDGVNTVTDGRAEVPYQIAVNNNPVITGITPTKGPTAGGTAVTISGSNFKSGATVNLGNAAASNVVVVNGNKITCTTPAHSAELVDVKVTNSNSAYGIKLRAFTYESSTADVYFPATVTGASGEIVTVPINGSNVNGLIAADITVSFDSAVLKPLGAKTGNLTPEWSVVSNTAQSGRITIAMAHTGSSTGSGVIANLEFEVLGSAGSSSALTFSSISLNSGAIPTQLSNGTFNVLQTYSITGSARFWKDSTAMSGVQLELDGNRLYKDTSAADGTYEITGIETGNYTLTASLDGNAGGITAYDASLVMRNSAGMVPLDTYQTTAADVNKSGTVDSMDASYILQHVVGLVDLPFTGAGVVWDFTPATRYYSSISSNRGSQNFYGILLGDVSGDWSASLDTQPVAPAEGTAHLYSQYRLDSGTNQLIVSVQIDPAGSSIYSMQGDVSYDADKAQLLSVVKGALISDWLCEANLDSASSARVACAGGTAVTGAGELVVLTFQLSGSSTDIGLRVDAVNLNEGQVGAVVRPAISGQVKDSDGNALSGVTIQLSDNGGSATTDSDGNYSLTVDSGWSGTITPLATGYAFTPESISCSNLTADKTGGDFTGTQAVASLSLTSPNGGETWVRGERVEITWISSNLTGEINVQLYKNSEFLGNFVKNLPVENGSYRWRVPADFTTGSDYQVKVVQGAVADYSDSTFSISDPSDLTPVNPDFNRDGKVDLLWRNYATGQNVYWYMNGHKLSDWSLISSVGDANWRMAGAGDFNGDGKSDIVWRNYKTGKNIVWLMSDTTYGAARGLPVVSDVNWRIAAICDFNGDKKDDILWRNYATGKNLLWMMNNHVNTASASIAAVSSAVWRIEAAADFNGDGKADILWRNYSNGRVVLWYMDGAKYTGSRLITVVSNLQARIEAVGDFNGDGKNDIFWRDYSNGKNIVWLMDGATKVDTYESTRVSDLNWVICNSGDGGYADASADPAAMKHAGEDDEPQMQFSLDEAVNDPDGNPELD